MPWWPVLAVAIPVLLLGAAVVLRPLDILNLFNWPRPPLRRGVPYGPWSRQRLDVYGPGAGKGADVILFFYGGRWRSGRRREYRFVATALTALGFVVVLPDYRLFPWASWREIVADAAGAYRWVERHIADCGGNPRRVFLMGHSAGAHLAAMVALDGGLRNRIACQTRPCGFIGLAGPYNFYPFTDPDVREVFGQPANPMETQPVSYVGPGSVPALLITGERDRTVSPRNGESLAAAIRASAGVVCERVYPRLGHVGVLLSLARPFRRLAPTLEDVAAFVQATGKGLEADPWMSDSSPVPKP